MMRTKPISHASLVRRRRPGLSAAFATLVLFAGAAAARPPLKLADDVDLNRMYGGWYIVATIPNSFEKGMVGPYDVYAPGPGGSIKEDFFVRRGRFDAERKHFRVRDFV